MSVRNIICDVLAFGTGSVKITAVPDTTSAGSLLILKDQYTAFAREGTPGTLVLPVKDSGTTTYKITVPTFVDGVLSSETYTVNLSADINLSELLTLGTASTDTILDAIDAKFDASVVRFDAAQTLTNEEKLQARTNIGAGTGGGGGGAVDSVNGLTGTVVLTTSNVAEGSNSYFTTARVLAVVLTGLSVATNSAALATDTVLVGLGKLQAQINALLTSLANYATKTGAETLTNKTISGASNTITNIAQSSVTNLTTDLANKADLVAGKVPSSQLPSFVDDVVEAANFAALPGTGETGKIYVTLDANKTYRWSGSAYVEISASPGSTDSVTEGSTNLYFTGARVIAAILTGLSTATSSAITSADSVLSGLGKLQGQINSLTTTVSGKLTASNNLSELTGTAATARTNLGLGSLATQNGSFSGTSSGTNTGDQNLSGYPTGSGTTNALAKWTGTNAVGNSSISDDGTDVTGGDKTLSRFAAKLNDQTGTSYTLATSDNGKVVTFSNASAITVTIPSTLGAGFNCLCVQKGAGQVTFTAGASATLRQRQTYAKIAGQYGAVTVVSIVSTEYILAGDMSA